ncbi:hypothetical protein CYMTET_38531 [Cymbomonas tetramitiformis]|uniref:Uncharacterized protein n=1 Tax=Cymbomonas tetramitiformis TaxID=36881 RepID=A0AAE0CBU0_9CHLO|nr:hypothetical protein CYMTET_38531 [Cymbomonas tetramitiformis]
MDQKGVNAAPKKAQKGLKAPRIDEDWYVVPPGTEEDIVEETDEGGDAEADLLSIPDFLYDELAAKAGMEIEVEEAAALLLAHHAEVTVYAPVPAKQVTVDPPEAGKAVTVDAPEPAKVETLDAPESAELSPKKMDPLLTHGQASPHGVTLQEAVWYLLDMKRRQQWTDAHFNTFMKILKMLLGGANTNLPGSLWHMLRLIGAETVWDYAVHVCPKYHRTFPAETKKPAQEKCGVPIAWDAAGVPVGWCEEERYSVTRTARGEVYRPQEYYFYFPVKRLVRRWMRNAKFAKMRADTQARAPTNACVMTSPHVARINEHSTVGGRLLQETESTDPMKPGMVRAGMAVEYGEDDARAKKHDKQGWSTRFGAMRSADLHPRDRVRMEFTGLVIVVPGPRQHWKNNDVIQERLVKELKELRDGHADDKGTPFRVYDGYFGKWHDKFSVFLVLCYCDTVARNDLGRFAPVAARRNDYLSLWEGTPGPTGGMYCLGYAKPIAQSYLPDGETVHAWDPSVLLTQEDHEELVKLTQEGADPMRTGRYGKGPLEALEYFTAMSAYVLPFMHCMTFGVVKSTVKMFRHKVPNCDDTCYFNAAQLKQLQKNGKGLCAPHDMHREYQDVVQYAGNYTMEDWLNFILIFSPLVFMDVLESLNRELDRAWWKLREAVIYFIRQVCAGTIEDRAEARAQAELRMREFAVIIENECPMNMLTLNLRLAVVHLCKQEEKVGVVSSNIELWVERLLGEAKGVVPEPVGGKAIDSCIGNAYLLKDRVDDMAHLYPGIRFLPDYVAHSVKQDGPGFRDDPGLACHFMDVGHHIIRGGVAVSALSADAEGRLLPGLAASLRAMHGERYELERDALDVLCFPRMRHGDEDFTSTMYTRAVTRISYNVALASSEADAFEYGRVEAYYLIWDPATHCAVCRLAMVTAYPTIKNARMNSRAVFVLNEDAKHTLLMPASRLETKCICHRPPGFKIPLHAIYLWPGMKSARCSRP